MIRIGLLRTNWAESAGSIAPTSRGRLVVSKINRSEAVMLRMGFMHFEKRKVDQRIVLMGWYRKTNTVHKRNKVHPRYPLYLELQEK